MRIHQNLIHVLKLGVKLIIYEPKGANPQRVSTEIIIEIKQLYSGRIASNPFIASNRRYMVFPLRDHVFIENGYIENKCSTEHFDLI